MESCAEYIHALNASISLFLRVLCAEGRKKKRKTNPSNDKISVRIREKKKKREKGKGEEKRNYAEERYTDNIYRQRRLLK